MKYFANIGGRCESFSINGEPQAGCKNVVFNIAYKTDRVTFIFFLGRDHGFAFSGGKDEQPTPDVYRLTVSNVNVEQKQIAAEGACELRGDIAAGAVLNCEATTTVEPRTTYKVSFKSQGKPEVARFN
ncbi:MAG: hypothetical protein ACXWC4_09160 [Telluria sp.]